MKLRRGGSLQQVTFRLTRGSLLPILLSLSISNQHILLVGPNSACVRPVKYSSGRRFYSILQRRSYLCPAFSLKFTVGNLHRRPLSFQTMVAVGCGVCCGHERDPGTQMKLETR
jgi:hypothetical protein